jgi:glycolate oxidase FAD binding subunit
VSLATRSAGTALAAVLGPRLRDDAATLAGAAVDGLTPRWVARPASVEELARVLALAHEEGLAVAPRGSGSALELGRPPRRLDLVLDVGGLDAIIEYNPDDLTVTAQAGVTGGALAARLADHRQILPLDPPGWRGRTVGGIVATQASGPRRIRYGAPRDLLLGVRFVQADGVSTWGGARVVKSVTGYDVPKLLAGSLGTLGVLAELTLRLHPASEAEATTVALLPGPAQVQDFVARLLDSAVQPDRVEYLDGAALTACGVGGAGAGVAVSIATVAEAVRAQQTVVARLAGEAGGGVVEAPAGFWSDYERVQLAGGPIVLRVSTLVTRVSSTAAALAGCATLVTGSIALGLLRVGLPAQTPAAAASLVARLHADVGQADGSVIVERAPREVREAVDPWGPVADGALDLMRALKTEFDPRGVLNPGRFVGGL